MILRWQINYGQSQRIVVESEKQEGKKMAKLYNEHTKELNDKAIMVALASATKDYEDGSIIECCDTLIEIVWAIQEYMKDND